MDHLSNNIRKLRRDIRTTQEEFANKIGTNRTNVGNWETGVAVPPISAIIAMSNLFKISIDDLILKDLTEEENKVSEGEAYCGKRHCYVRVPVNTEATITRSQLQKSVQPIDLPWISEGVVVFMIGGDGPGHWLKAGEVVFCRPVKYGESESGLHIVWMNDRLKAMHLERVGNTLQEKADIGEPAGRPGSAPATLLADNALLWKVLNKYTDELENARRDDLLQDVLRRLSVLEGKK